MCFGSFVLPSLAITMGPSIQALGRWLNPESLRIYARMNVLEYTHWIDKIMSFKTVDASRTTSLPVCDEGPIQLAVNQVPSHTLSFAPWRIP